MTFYCSKVTPFRCDSKAITSRLFEVTRPRSPSDRTILLGDLCGGTLASVCEPSVTRPKKGLPTFTGVTFYWCEILFYRNTGTSRVSILSSETHVVAKLERLQKHARYLLLSGRTDSCMHELPVKDYCISVCRVLNAGQMLVEILATS